VKHSDSTCFWDFRETGTVAADFFAAHFLAADFSAGASAALSAAGLVPSDRSSLLLVSHFFSSGFIFLLADLPKAFARGLLIDLGASAEATLAVVGCAEPVSAAGYSHEAVSHLCVHMNKCACSSGFMQRQCCIRECSSGASQGGGKHPEMAAPFLCSTVIGFAAATHLLPSPPSPSSATQLM
jgi:hypothetical protein